MSLASEFSGSSGVDDAFEDHAVRDKCKMMFHAVNLTARPEWGKDATVPRTDWG